jgi:Cohesin loading factor
MENKVPPKVEMQTRLRLAEVLICETENLEVAEDLLSKGVHILYI